MEFHVDVLGPRSVLANFFHFQRPTVFLKDLAHALRRSGFYRNSCPIYLLQEFRYSDNFPQPVGQSCVFLLCDGQCDIGLQLGFLH